MKMEAQDGLLTKDIGTDLQQRKMSWCQSFSIFVLLMEFNSPFHTTEVFSRYFKVNIFNTVQFNHPIQST